MIIVLRLVISTYRHSLLLLTYGIKAELYPLLIPNLYSYSSFNLSALPPSSLKSCCITIDESFHSTLSSSFSSKLPFQSWLKTKAAPPISYCCRPSHSFCQSIISRQKDSAMQDGFVKSWPKTLLQVEGACIFSSTIWAFSRLHQPWWTFAGLLLVPDLGMAGYLANTSIGAALYNSVHTETPPILLLCTALARNNNALTGLALCWLAHIGMDRMLGYGLKYGTGFTHTHLGIFGRKGGKGSASQ